MRKIIISFSILYILKMQQSLHHLPNLYGMVSPSPVHQCNIYDNLGKYPIIHIAYIFLPLSTARWSVESLVWPDTMMEFGTKLLFSK